MNDTDKERLREEIDLALREKEYRKSKQEDPESGKKGKSKGTRSTGFVPPFDPVSKKSPYEILGVDPKASAKEIKDTYRSLMRRYHPDLGPDAKIGDTPDTIIKIAQDKTNREIWTKRINEAYEILSDTEKRTLYDIHGYGTSESVGGSTPPSKTAIRFWEGVYQGKTPLESMSPGMGRYSDALGPGVFRFENLDLPSGKKSFMDYMTEFDKEQERLDKSPICVCNEPVFPRGYKIKGNGKDTCMYCGKVVMPGSRPPSNKQEPERKSDIKGLGPGMGKVG
jgi:DnaJ-domain-containing protein 1